MKLTSFLIIFSVLTSQANAKLIDKIAGIVDDNIITLSQVQRMSKSLPLKKNIAPMIYDKSSYSNEEYLQLTVNKLLIRSKLNELGLPVGDDQVEAQVKANEKRLNVDRDQLKSFLKTQNSSYDEYFETLREAIEYSYFANRVISPLISVSEQEVKNEFIRKNDKNSRLNIRYSLVDYSISKEDKPKVDKNEFTNAVKAMRSNSVINSDYSSISSTNLDEITEEGLATELKNLLKSTDEGMLSTVIFLNGANHIFYVAKKDLVETDAYSKQKEKIRDEIFERNVKNETSIWFEREKNKHYIKLSL